MGTQCTQGDGEEQRSFLRACFIVLPAVGTDCYPTQRSSPLLTPQSSLAFSHVIQKKLTALQDPERNAVKAPHLLFNHPCLPIHSPAPIPNHYRDSFRVEPVTQSRLNQGFPVVTRNWAPSFR